MLYLLVHSRPLIGGLFSDPAERFEIFHDSTIFKRYPYLLPCLVCGIMQLLATLMIYFGVEEVCRSKEAGVYQSGLSRLR